MSNSDLFDDYSPTLKECDGCKESFEESKLSRCKLCGKYFCPECRKTHDCRKDASKNNDAEENIDTDTDIPTIDYERCAKYFSDSNYYGYSMIIGLGVVILIIGLCVAVINPSASSILVAILTIMLGITVAALGGMLCYWDTQNTPTDEEMDKICQKYIKYRAEIAIKKIGIDESQLDLIEPLIYGHYYIDKIGDKEFKYRNGRQDYKRVISSNYEMICLFFTNEQVFKYVYRFSVINDDEKYEMIDEAFYSDIVSITSESEVGNYPNSNKKYNYETLLIVNSGGTTLSASINEEDSLYIDKLNDSIFAMKQLVRDKKNQDDSD